jgi:hypothetical protein
MGRALLKIACARRILTYSIPTLDQKQDIDNFVGFIDAPSNVSSTRTDKTPLIFHSPVCLPQLGDRGWPTHSPHRENSAREMVLAMTLLGFISLVT